MRWSTVRLIWFREMRDQLRDRRTVFMVVVLPVLLYPLLGYGVLQFTVGFVRQASVVGVVGPDHLPANDPPPPTPAAAVAWLMAQPGPLGQGFAGVAGACGRAHADALVRGSGYPPLYAARNGVLRFAPSYFEFPLESETLTVRPLGGLVERGLLDDKRVDALLVVPPDFREQLACGGRPALLVLSRDGDDRSRMVNARLHAVLARWKNRLKEIRLLRRGLPADFDEPFAIDNPERSKPPAEKAAEGLFDMVVRLFPFMLVMWSLAGALYPAVDLCAGEKERGTMETLLITPASREEIVWGKFLTIWVFSAATALLNLASMGLSTWQFSGVVPDDVLRAGPLVWAVVLLMPLSAFFSALCLSVGAYARSSKEGQYYLMPLFLVSMPLIFLTLAPGVELNAFYSMVPVTGVALLLQKLMTAATPEQVPWLFFLPVLGPLTLYSWLSLRWAIFQFNREEVLFREAERLDLGLWLKRLLREKEPLPTVGQALFCFGLLIGLRWLTIGLGPTLGLLTRSGVGLVAFMAAPPLFMAVLLTTRPREALALRRPAGKDVLIGAALALLLLLPLMQLTQFVLTQFPAIKELLDQNQPLTQELRRLQEARDEAGGAFLSRVGVYLLLLGVLPAVCEELAFRGFLLTALLRRFRPATAIFLSSFLFALVHLNVFQFLPTLVVGTVLGTLAWKSGSVVPSMAFHLVHNGVLVGLNALAALQGAPEALPPEPLVSFVLQALCLVLAFLLLLRMVRPLSVSLGTVRKQVSSP